MTWTDALVLGLLQGLTEFLPISSSGHLVLAQHGLGIDEPGAGLEIAVHLGTLASVVLYYRRDLVEILRDVLRGGPAARLGWLVVVGTLPIVVVGLTLREPIAAAFDEPLYSAGGLLVTGVLMMVSPLARRRPGEPRFGYALLVGCAQAVAILPGVSRSGSTIATGMFAGDDPVRAARFSFLLSIPAISGAAILMAKDGAFAGRTDPVMLLGAGAVAFVSGLAAIAFLLRVLGRGRLFWFGPYCLVLGATALWLLA